MTVSLFEIYGVEFIEKHNGMSPIKNGSELFYDKRKKNWKECGHMV